MDNITFVTTSLKYFDENNEKYEGILKHAKFVKFIPSENDMSHNVIKFFDKDKMEIYKSRYEIIGLYNTEVNSWTWSWALPNFQKNNTGTARKLLNYGLMLNPTAKNQNSNTTDSSIKYLKTELITSRFRVADLIQLDIHVAIASYMSKNPFVYKYGIAKYNILSDGSREISNENAVDTDGYITLNHNVDDTMLVYYMFLLDYDKLELTESDECTTNVLD